MKKVKIIISVLLFLMQLSCIKKHNCNCYDGNSNKIASSFIVKGTKKNAERKCSGYSHENEAPWPPTTCKIED